MNGPITFQGQLGLTATQYQDLLQRGLQDYMNISQFLTQKKLAESEETRAQTRFEQEQADKDFELKVLRPMQTKAMERQAAIEELDKKIKEQQVEIGALEVKNAPRIQEMEIEKLRLQVENTKLQGQALQAELDRFTQKANTLTAEERFNGALQRIQVIEKTIEENNNLVGAYAQKVEELSRTNIEQDRATAEMYRQLMDAVEAENEAIRNSPRTQWLYGIVNAGLAGEELPGYTEPIAPKEEVVEEEKTKGPKYSLNVKRAARALNILQRKKAEKNEEPISEEISKVLKKYGISRGSPEWDALMEYWTAKYE